MSVENGFFEKNIGTGANRKHGLRVSKGNEIPIITDLSVDTTATAANQLGIVVPLGLRYRLTRLSVRPTTAVVAADTTAGVIKVSYAVQGTATLADSSLSLTMNTTVMGATTNNSTDSVLAAPLAMPGGTLVMLRHVQAAGGSPTGVCVATVYAVEDDPNTEA